MCCEDYGSDTLPPPVWEMLDRYRALLAERTYDWGDELEAGLRTLVQFSGWCDTDKWASVAYAATNAPGSVEDPVAFVIDSLLEPLPAGLAIVGRDGITVADPLPFVLPGRPLTYHLLIAGDQRTPAKHKQVVVSSEDPELDVNGYRTQAVQEASVAQLRLVANGVSRWTVRDERGGGWFPDDVLRKFDSVGSPFFHGNDVVLDVPAGSITVSVTRGCEFKRASITVEAREGQETLVELSPQRLYDAAAMGWYGGDLHVHMNLTGDQVATPRDASLMQQGEGLHLMNLVASNLFTATIFDREMLEQFPQQDLPWATSHSVARCGAEYRNDLLGHFTALNPAAPPTRYNTGHARSDEPQDWPPNAFAAEEFRDLGATVAYTHPIGVSISDSRGLGEIFADHRARSTEAREVVADAALGLIDAFDLGGPCHVEGTEFLYHRLLGCGLRLAATAGTDAMLSHSHSSLRSNPPGWCRAYANLGERPLSVTAWQDAVRAGRTFVTNGPWLELEVAGCGIGETHCTDAPGAVPVVARMVGLKVEHLEIVGPEGPLARVDVQRQAGTAELVADIDVGDSMWVAAVARGGDGGTAFGSPVQAYAHTSPVWVEVTGRPVARAADAAWCLDWLQRLEALARRNGTFAGKWQQDELVRVFHQAGEFYRGIMDSE